MYNLKEKIEKTAKRIAGVLFLIALAIHIKVTLDDPFVMLSDKVIAQITDSIPATSTATTSNENCASSSFTGPLWQRCYHNITCAATLWEKIEYFSAGGTLVGVSLTRNGVVVSYFTGRYSSTKRSIGGTLAYDTQGWECADGWFFCLSNSNPCD